jgi:hypothetical protein
VCGSRFGDHAEPSPDPLILPVETGVLFELLDVSTEPQVALDCGMENEAPLH